MVENHPTLPPENLSITFQIKCDWAALRRRVENNDDVSIQVVAITQKLVWCEAAHAAGRFTPEYDWTADLSSARLTHVQNLAWLDQTQANHAAYSAFWKDIAKRQYDFAEKIAFGGMNYILIGHGTVAVTCLNALVAGKAQVFPGALKTAIAGAVIGVLFIACAQLIAANSLSELSNRIMGRLVSRPSVRRLNALSRLSEKYKRKYSVWAERLIYASLITFVIYIAIALMLIGFTQPSA